MQLGLKRNEVKLVPYTFEWRNEFDRIKNEVLHHTSLPANRIEHIGSTAIEGMLSKPIIDILIGTDELPNEDSPLINQLKACNFHRLKVKRPGEIVFAKFTDETFEEKTHFVHLVEYGGELWNNLLFFRNYLNKTEEARKEYTDLKLTYTERNDTGIKEYTDHKEEFVKKIFERRKDAEY